MGVTKVIKAVTKSDLYRVFQGRTGFGFDIYVEILSSGWYLSGKAQRFQLNIRTKISGKLASLQLGSDYYKLPVEGTQVPNEEWFLQNIMALKISWADDNALKFYNTTCIVAYASLKSYVKGMCPTVHAGDWIIQ